jgi:hypothetical protein
MVGLNVKHVGGRVTGTVKIVMGGGMNVMFAKEMVNILARNVRVLKKHVKYARGVELCMMNNIIWNFIVMIVRVEELLFVMNVVIKGL